jgi:hypothetical protein
LSKVPTNTGLGEREESIPRAPPVRAYPPFPSLAS